MTRERGRVLTVFAGGGGQIHLWNSDGVASSKYVGYSIADVRKRTLLEPGEIVEFDLLDKTASLGLLDKTTSSNALDKTASPDLLDKTVSSSSISLFPFARNIDRLHVTSVPPGFVSEHMLVQGQFLLLHEDRETEFKSLAFQQPLSITLPMTATST